MVAKTRNQKSYSGTTIVGGFTLRTRDCDYLGVSYTVPEHIVPVVHRKNGKVSYACWQVRISKPFRSFSTLNDATDFLSTEIKENPPKHEGKFDFDEAKNKIYPTGLVGGYFQVRLHKGSSKKEIRLNLTFKRHYLAFYIGTLNTANKARYKECFIKAYVLRKWLEKLTKERDFSWMNEDKAIKEALLDDIPEAFREHETEKAMNKIIYEGFERFILDSALIKDGKPVK